MIRISLVCGVVIVVAVGFADARKSKRKSKSFDTESVSTALSQRMASVKKTETLLLTKLDTRTGEVRRRVRSLYKLMRAGPAALWVEPTERALTVRRRAAASRILRRDFRELALLRQELGAVQTARERLHNDKKQLARLTWPERRSLRSPVAGKIRIAARFGDYKRKKPHRLSLTRRGVALRVKRGRSVASVADGRVRFIGDIRGLGQTVIVEHHGFLSVIGPIERPKVSKLQQLTEGTELGVSAGTRLYIEVRLPIGAGGFPIDPAPLLRRQ